jgi:hypothetical protein
MKHLNLFLGLLLTFGLHANSFAGSDSLPPFSANECSAKVLGGDTFPWSVAQPFPWADIQGVWKLREGTVPYYLKAKIIRTTTNRKILNLSIVSEGNCTKPVAQGVGYIDFSEKNVVRAIMNDGVSKYQMKLASFDVRDIALDRYVCGGDNIMVASLQPLGSFRNAKSSSNRSISEVDEDGAENLVLKKTTSDLNSICRKLENRN